MYSVEAYKLNSSSTAILSPLELKRDWQNETGYEHVYKCFPLTLANTMGWGISYPEDLSFMWDGRYTGSSDTVKILKGHNWLTTTRGYATVNFRTGIKFKTDPDVSMLGYPVPNQFIDGFQSFTSLISTSFFMGEWQVAGRITTPNKIITIKAGTPISAVMPISLTHLNNSEIIEKPIQQLDKKEIISNEYASLVGMTNVKGGVLNFYRNATDMYGNKIGEHEIKALKLHYRKGK